MIKEEISDIFYYENPKALLANGFEDAFIGIAHISNGLACYDYEKCIWILEHRDKKTREEAEMFLTTYVGENAPIFITLNEPPLSYNLSGGMFRNFS